MESTATGQRLRPNPEQKASLLSTFLFCFIQPLLRLGYRKPLEMNDLSDILPENEASRLTSRLKRYWKAELVSSKKACRPPSLLKAVYNMEKRMFWRLGLLLFIEEVVRGVQPYFMGRVIRYFHAGGQSPLGLACCFAAALSCCAFCSVICHHRHFYKLQHIGMQIRIAVSGLVYSKLLSVDIGALKEVTHGHVINLISTDVARCDQMVLFLHYFWASPVSLITLTVVLYLEMQSSCFAGFGVLFILIPIQMVIGRMMGKFRRKVAEKADKRIGIMNEILSAVRVIKMYAWEYPFIKMIKSARSEEVQKLRYHALCQAIVIGSYYVSGRLALLGALSAHVLNGLPLTSEVIFVGAAMFNIARLTLSLYLPFAVQNFVELRVTMERVQKFLLLQDKASLSPPTSIATGGRSGRVMAKDFSASWSKEENGSISSVSFSVGPGELLVIVGPLGSGKSTILHSILKELEQSSGHIDVQGRIAYVPQEAWLFPGTIQQNVVFGSEMNKERYRRALVVSSLKQDLQGLPDGDQTYVGDKGSTLSGGQKARVNLARAIYQDADIYLLDDPLSAVDSTVGKAIFESCVLGYLKTKARILVTHQLHYLKGADKILVMEQGRQVACGSYTELMANEEQFMRIMQETEMSYQCKRQQESALQSLPSATTIEAGPADSPASGDEASSTGSNSEECEIVSSNKGTTIVPTVHFRSDSSGKPDAQAHEALLDKDDDKAAVNGQLTSWNPDRGVNFFDENVGHKGVGWKVYYAYMRAIGHPILVLLLMLMVVAVQMHYSFCDWWLRRWSNDEELRAFAIVHNSTMTPGAAESSMSHLHTWATLLSALLVLSVAQAIVLRFSLLLAAFRLHSMMFKRVIRACVVFFDLNPIGRILNRFSKDTNIMDELLAFVLFDFILGSLLLLSYVLMNGILNPWMFVVLVPLLCAFGFLRHYYMQSARPLKRLEASARSPVYSHFSATLNGLTVIRAFRAEDKVTACFVQHLNVHSVPWSSLLAATRLFSIYVDSLSAVYVTLVAFLSLLMASDLVADTGTVGLSLFYASSLTGFLQFMLRQSIDVANMMVAVERIVEYANLPLEAALTSDHPPPDDWPSRGEVVFDKVSLRYGKEAPYALRDVSFKVAAGEKIGLVGRTGAGKSSIITVLFRLVEPEGRITVDNVDTTTIGLHELRKRISIIPQDPALFLGTLRLNLDPFNEYSDEEIWNALDQVQLKPLVVQLRDGLDSGTDEGGHNYSIGQRQLLCMARALLRKNKVLILDEVTANVDLNTDALIQQTIRSQFKHCTVFTIAHRLNTVMDCDRILVIHQGRVVENDEPTVLLANQDSMLSQFVLETGEENAMRLRRMASRARAERHRGDGVEKAEMKKLQ